MFSALVEFKEVHGHCKVPTKWPENRKLGNWVALQRNKLKKYQFTKEADVEILREPQKIEELQSIKKRTQRLEELQSIKERVQRLNEIGFSWWGH